MIFHLAGADKVDSIRFRMVVLADEVLESFFDSDLSASFRLEPIPENEMPASLPSGGLLGDLWSTIATDSNKKIFNMFTDEIGKTIGKHQVCATPIHCHTLTIDALFYR